MDIAAPGGAWHLGLDDGPGVRLLLHGLRDRGPWGASIAGPGPTRRGGDALLGDGSYLMLNSELYSAAFAGHPYVAVVCDNGGYAVIHRLQTGQGAPGFNNLLSDVAGPGGVRVDFVAHARSLGCTVEDVPEGAPVGDLAAAYGGPARRRCARAVRRSWCAAPTRPPGPRRARSGRWACRAPVRTRGVRRAQGHQVRWLPSGPAPRRRRGPLLPTRPTRSRRSFPLSCEVLMTIVVVTSPLPRARRHSSGPARRRDARGEARGRQLDARESGVGPTIPQTSALSRMVADIKVRGGRRGAAQGAGRDPADEILAAADAAGEPRRRRAEEALGRRQADARQRGQTVMLGPSAGAQRQGLSVPLVVMDLVAGGRPAGRRAARRGRRRRGAGPRGARARPVPGGPRARRPRRLVVQDTDSASSARPTWWSSRSPAGPAPRAEGHVLPAGLRAARAPLRHPAERRHGHRREHTDEDWSFGHGRAQFLTGEL